MIKIAETFRRGKIEDYIKRLHWRKEIMVSQINKNEFSCIRDNLLGQIQSIDFVLNELTKEFSLFQEEKS